MAKAAGEGTEVTQGEPHSVEQDSSSSMSSDTDSSSHGLRNPRQRTSEIRRLVSTIFGHIRSLYKASLLLRRSVIHDKYIRSASKNQNVSYFAVWDEAHVSEKIAQWALDMGLRYEKLVDNPLVSRLAAANTRRREQLQYWQLHPDRPTSISIQPVEFPQKQPAPPKDPEVGTAPGQVHRPWEVGCNTATPSRDTKRSFSLAAKSVLDDNETFSGRPKTVYEPSTQDVGRYSRIPDVPHSPPGSLTFNCPFCLSELEVRVMQQRQLWK
jgi:hypothetical protein